MKHIILALAILLTLYSNAQRGVIKGQIVDQQSDLPLMGVSIELLNQQTPTGTITDNEGYYFLANVPLGRQSLKISYLGYESITSPNIIVTAGKDAIADFRLIESFGELDEVIITSERPKDKPINTLSSVSARQFSMEEVQRFSGGRSDIGRLASNFAGVSSPDDSRNDIVVRGNSPTGLLYRLEGVPIPNPNHFTSTGTTGGAVSAVNPNILKNSDFLTSAFPAEYGNALGGVFDLGFRTGNKDEYEFTAQLGAFTGVEALAEGPFGKNNGSFIVGARYSLIGLIGAGAGGTAATPNYADISFNIDFGTSKAGTFSVFGILGDSDIDFLGVDIDEDDLFAAEDEDLFVESAFGVIGLKHKIRLNDNSYLQSVVSTSFTTDAITSNRYINKNQVDERIILYTENDNTENRLTFSTFLNSKLNKRTTIRTGVLFERFNVEALLRDRTEQPDLDGDGDPDIFTFRDINENLSIFQPYIQSQFRLTETLNLNAGIHAQYSTLNEQLVIEPRAGMQYKLAKSHTISLGYGLHHQLVPLPILFLNEEINGQLILSNRDLDFVRSNHFVAGYDVRLAKNWRAKLEAYYQNITNAAVEPFSSSYSSLTEGADFVFDNDRVSLVNEGTGYNQGIELTLEKFFSDSYYGLITTSIFESKYEGSDGVERNSPFNNGYVANLLAGREFKIGKQKQNIFFIDTRFSVAGGRYFTPIDLEASQNAGFEILQEALAFSKQYDDYLRWDVKFGFKINVDNKKQSHQFYLDLQNITNRDNVFVQRYNRLTNQVDQINQIGFFPDVGYRFQF